MKVRDMFTTEFAAKYGDVDVFNDVTDEGYCAFCGPTLLTEEGEKRYELVLDDEILAFELPGYEPEVTVQIDALSDWEEHDEMLRELFADVAGYCSDKNWDKWFKDGDGDEDLPEAKPGPHKTETINAIINETDLDETEKLTLIQSYLLNWTSEEEAQRIIRSNRRG